MSLGVEVNVLPAAVEAARRNGGVVIAQTNAEMPWTYGDALLDLDHVDVLVDADGPLPHAPAGSVDEDVGDDRELVAERVSDGATLQAGIGAVPDATMHGLRRSLAGCASGPRCSPTASCALERAGALDRDLPIDGVVPVRLARAARVGRRQRAGRDAADRGDQQTRP